jgi:hypothetical protein
MPSVLTERKPFDGRYAQRMEDLLPERAIRFLQRESGRLDDQITHPRPWDYAELHNPWARSAASYDSWGFLDLCQSSALVDAIATLIGEDVILFDSQWLPDRWHAPGRESDLESDAHRFPVDPPNGVTALIAFADAPSASIRIGVDDPRPCVSFDLARGTVLLVGHMTPYCLQSSLANGRPAVFAVRYFPASSRYNRDAAAPVHRALTERYPLFNYARMPLWLVRGEDRAQNDFVTGFNMRAGFWTSARW